METMDMVQQLSLVWTDFYNNNIDYILIFGGDMS